MASCKDISPTLGSDNHSCFKYSIKQSTSELLTNGGLSQAGIKEQLFQIRFECLA